MKKFWLGMSGVCGALALVFLFRNAFEEAFIAAASGAVAWFLSYRFRMKEIVDLQEATEIADGDVESDEK